MIDDYIKKLLKQAEQQEKWAANYMPDNYDDNPTTPKERYQHAKECRQLAEWLKELKHYREVFNKSENDKPTIEQLY